MLEDILICTSCGNTGTPISTRKGSFIFELLIWVIVVTLLLFEIAFSSFYIFIFLVVSIIIGIVYSAWRGNNKKDKCSLCGKDTMIPINTPVGKNLYEKYYKEEPLKDKKSFSHYSQTGPILKKEKRGEVKKKAIIGSLLIVFTIYIVFYFLISSFQ